MSRAFSALKTRFTRHTQPRAVPAVPWKPTRRFSDSRHENTYLIDDPIEEELLPDGRLKNFHPTRPGDILDGRFKAISKLGYGSGSTVWLAENLKFKEWTLVSRQLPQFVSIKIAALDADASGEAERSKLIAEANPSHDGREVIRASIDQFQLQVPNGTHFCLVYEPMRGTLFQLQQRLHNQRFAYPHFKFLIYCLLQALDYLHTECRLIHTDIKDDNIMVTIESDDVLKEYVALHSEGPHYRHIRSQDGRVVYLSQPDFGPLRGNRLIAFGFRPQLPSADIWNLGLLMWNMLEDANLFGKPAGEDGEYDAHVHLAQMVAVLGDPPAELIRRERLHRDHRLKYPLINLRGKQVNNMNDFWGGPFFDDNEGIMADQMIRKDLIQERRSLGDTVTEVSGEEKAIFLDLASQMLEWLPEKRKTAKELLQHPIFESIRQDRARDEGR